MVSRARCGAEMSLAPYDAAQRFRIVPMKRTIALRAAPRRHAPATVDEYFVRVPEPGRSVLIKLRAAIRSVLPRDATEIISYQIPAFARDGVIVWYAAFADHVSLFPRGSVLAKSRTN